LAATADSHFNLEGLQVATAVWAGGKHKEGSEAAPYLTDGYVPDAPWELGDWKEARD
jgi:hypothetical protein